MDKLKRSICYTEVEERNFKETYVFPHKNQEYKCYECLNCKVLEYQDKLREFLEMVKGLLREGGYIAGSVPNRKRLFVEMDWKYFHGGYPPHHFLRFSKSSLKKALNFSGFKDVDATYCFNVNKNGFNLGIALNSVVYHKEGQSTGANKEFKSELVDILSLINRTKFHKKYLGEGIGLWLGIAIAFLTG
jgi:hypothetical protein